MDKLISNNDITTLTITLLCAFVLWFLSKHYKAVEEIIEDKKVKNKEDIKTEQDLINQLDNISKTKTIEVDPTKFDDFIAIEGIGPKINELLHSSNIHTFDTLAYTSTEDLQRILDNAGHHFKMANPKTWPEQARLASEGNWERLRDYQDMLYSGI